MNNRFESDNKLLIISPTQEDFNDLRIKFEESDTKVLYLAQVRELSDDNSYDTFIFYYKGESSFIFHEYENPSHLSYSTNVNEGTIQDYWERLSEIEKLDKTNFFKYSEIDFNYKELDAKISEGSDLVIKKNKRPKM